MNMNYALKNIVALSLAAFVSSAAQATSLADFEAFNIRNHNGSITTPWDGNLSILENAAGDGFSATTPDSGQKVGYGTHAFDGMQVNQLQSVTFTRDPGSVDKLPYINLWVSDGVAGNYAILSLGGDYRGDDFSTGTQNWLLYEYNTANNIDWLFSGGTNTLVGHQIKHNGSLINLADINSGVTLSSPSGSYPSYVGTGAPRGGYGLNIIFGDTAANYLGAMNISDLTVTHNGTEYCASNAVPDQGSTLALFGFALVGVLSLRRRFSK